MIFILPFLLFWTVSNSTAHAYSNFISRGYTSCLTCHYNALGDGPLNDYGRAVSATAISSRFLYSSKVDDQYLGDHSNFFFGGLREQKWLRPSIDVRGMRYTQNFTKGGSISRNILMQADGNLVIRPVERDRLFFSASYGYAPIPIASKNDKNSKPKTVISREHYMQISLGKSHRFYLGFLDKAYGLRIPDHVAYSRSKTGLAQNDQTHGIMYHYYDPQFEIAVHGFGGNLYQDADLRQKGGSLFFEYELATKTRLGGSVLVSQNQYLKYMMSSFQFRLGFGEGASLISELGQITKTPLTIDTKKTTGIYSFSQGSMELVRGFNFLTTFEYYKSDISSEEANTNYRYGIGLQFFPIQRIEWRFDLVNSRILSNSTLNLDTIDLMSQVHLWF